MDIKWILLECFKWVCCRFISLLGKVYIFVWVLFNIFEVCIIMLFNFSWENYKKIGVDLYLFNIVV